MPSMSHLLFFLIFIFLPIFFFFSNFQLIAGAGALTRKRDDDLQPLQLDLAEDTGSTSRKVIEKVSGEDESDETKDLLVEKVRILLGLKSRGMGRTLPGDNRYMLSPSPSPSHSLKALAPASISPIPTHKYTRSPLPHLTLAPPAREPESHGRDKTKARMRRLVIALGSSLGGSVVIVGLICILFCTFRRNRRSRRLKTAYPSNHMNKVSFDPGPDLFCLSSYTSVSERAAWVKAPCETLNKASFKESPLGSPLRQVGVSSVEEAQLEFSSPSAEEDAQPVEPLSSDDEQFHSVCNSNSSSGRHSNVSDTFLSNASEISTPSHPSMNSPSLNRSFEANTVSSVVNSPSRLEMSVIPSSLHISGENSAPCHPHSPKHEPLMTESSKIEEIGDSTWPHYAGSAPLAKPTATDCVTPVTPSQTSSPLIQSPPVTSHSSTASPNKPVSSTYSPSPSPNSESSTPGMLASVPPPKVPQSSAPPPSPPPMRLATIPPPPPPPFRQGTRPQPPLPPPPPPRIFKGGSTSGGPPPPPPCEAPPFTLVGKDGAPLPKLKPLHWDKVRATSDRSMVWDKMRSSSFELDEEMIESLFGYKIRNSATAEELNSKSPSPSKHVLDPKRLQNITILSKALNATSKEVCNALMEGQGLCAQQLEALVKMVPTKEEEDMLLNYKGDFDELGSAERYVRELLTVPFAFQRIEAMLYRDTFDDEVIHLRKSFAMLEEACKELRSSRLFLKMLEAVLKTGNRMNVGTIRGGAKAFKLDALLKLADVKGTDGKTTLLHFVVQEMIRTEGVRVLENDAENNKMNFKTEEEIEEGYKMIGLEIVSGLSKELCNVKKTATIDLDVLETSVSNLSDGMEKLRQLVVEVSPKGDREEGFSYSMKSFLKHAEQKIKTLKEGEDQVLLHVREITEYFHGNVSKDEANPLRIFVIVRDFLGMLDKVCKEVRSSKAQTVQNSVPLFR